ncbi:hypothetical protein R1sor_023742 [Riccia sorocarpa]|uniref:Uncharacterized protein n=1 Tax=Riccia sorocarpa TaxID=122646 RepID=A0ABD3GSJ0_9MARC
MSEEPTRAADPTGAKLVFISVSAATQVTVFAGLPFCREPMRAADPTGAKLVFISVSAATQVIVFAVLRFAEVLKLKRAGFRGKLAEYRGEGF